MEDSPYVTRIDEYTITIDTLAHKRDYHAIFSSKDPEEIAQARSRIDKDFHSRLNSLLNKG